MKSVTALLGCLLFLGVTPHRSEKTETEEIVKVLHFPAGDSSREIVVDNINGAINVIGYDGDEIQLHAHRTSYGDTEAKFLEGKEKIRLDISEEPGKVILFVKSPWRCNDGSGWHRWKDDYGFDADFDFDLKVPRKSGFALKTVNKGSITVSDMDGEFEVRNVNGGVRLSRIAGNGLAATVNGELAVSFTRNPTSRCAFRTVNGSIDVEFPDDLSADLRFKTFNGEVYSDFDVTGLPRATTKVEKIGGQTVYKGDEYSSVRAGKGGPELVFETLNGDIRILKAHN